MGVEYYGRGPLVEPCPSCKVRSVYVEQTDEFVAWRCSLPPTHCGWFRWRPVTKRAVDA